MPPRRKSSVEPAEPEITNAPPKSVKSRNTARASAADTKRVPRISRRGNPEAGLSGAAAGTTKPGAPGKGPAVKQPRHKQDKATSQQPASTHGCGSAAVPLGNSDPSRDGTGGSSSDGDSDDNKGAVIVIAPITPKRKAQGDPIDSDGPLSAHRSRLRTRGASAVASSLPAAAAKGQPSVIQEPGSNGSASGVESSAGSDSSDSVEEAEQQGGQTAGVVAATGMGAARPLRSRDVAAAATVASSHKAGGTARSKRHGAAARAAAEEEAAAAAAAEVDTDLLGDVELKEVLQTLLRGGWQRNGAQKRARSELLLLQQPRWLDELLMGNSLLLYGFGSKRRLLNDFARRVLSKDGSNPGIILFHGWLAGLTARHIVLTAAKALTGVMHKSVPTVEVLRAIAEEPAGRSLYIILHNIDGPGLRGGSEQALLSQLSACHNIHLVASIDHINAPLLWDREIAARFQWVWHDATTFEPYVEETRDVPPALSGCTRQNIRRSIGVVLHSLPANAREVFRVLAEKQVEAEADGPPGLAFADLYLLCRRRFLVANEPALRDYLKEFADHDLLGSRFGEEGDEVLFIPHGPEALQEALDAMDAEIDAANTG